MEANTNLIPLVFLIYKKAFSLNNFDATELLVSLLMDVVVVLNYIVAQLLSSINFLKVSDIGNTFSLIFQDIPVMIDDHKTPSFNRSFLHILIVDNYEQLE